jgi:hypothetical protein
MQNATDASVVIDRRAEEIFDFATPDICQNTATLIKTIETHVAIVQQNMYLP